MKSPLQAMGAVLAISLMTAPSVMAGNCDALPKETQLQSLLAKAPTIVGPPIGGTVGGLFNGTRMWGAVVDRDGTLCAFVTSTTDPSQVWPGSQAIAKAKAYTANAFSLDVLALSTAQLYTFVQPGHSLFGLNNSNPFATDFLAPLSGSEGGGGRSQGGLSHLVVECRCTKAAKSSAGWGSVAIRPALTMKSLSEFVIWPG